MQKGAFKSFRHEHHFESKEGGTLMTDIFVFESPLGIIGKLANKLVLHSYMSNFLEERNNAIKEAAESGDWRKFVLTDQDL